MSAASSGPEELVNPNHNSVRSYNLEAENGSHVHFRASRTATTTNSSCRQSPSPQIYRPSKASYRRDYSTDASIVLVGIRGTGLSTLAIMAATAIGFRLLDSDQYFYQATGLSRSQYKSAHGTVNYRHEEINLLRSMLLKNPSNTVIVCGPGAVEARGQLLLSEYAQDHPVIYVMRDVKGIQQHLKIWDAQKILEITRLSAPALRSISNYEFYNMSEFTRTDSSVDHSPEISSPKSLALKQVEVDFLQLIQSIPGRNCPSPEDGVPWSLTSRPVDTRPFTYALIIPLSISEPFWSRIRFEDVLADAVELAISWSEVQPEISANNSSIMNLISRQFYAIRRTIRLPIIFNVKLDDASNKSHLSLQTRTMESDQYFEILHHGLRLGADFLVVHLDSGDDRIKHLISSKGATKVIAYHFDASPSPRAWDSPARLAKVSQAESMGSDIVWLSQEATCDADNFSVRHFVDKVIASAEHKISIIAYNTGRLGRMSCYTNSMLSPVTCDLVQAYTSGDEQPSQLLTTQQAQTALYSSLMLDPLYFGIYGNNVALSLSPEMHNAAFRFSGMPHTYKIFQNQNLNELRSLIADPNFGGASITAPFKTEVIPLMDFMSPEAHAIGAINTLIPLRTASMSSLLDRNRAGKAVALYGENSDWIGVQACVRPNLSPINAVKRRTTALVVGAGGMARAAVFSLIRLGLRNIFVHNRTRSNAEALITHFQKYRPVGSIEGERTLVPTMRILEKKTDSWPQDADLPSIVISCVPTREAGSLTLINNSLPENWLGSPTGGVAVEIKEMSDRGWIAVDGLKVLPAQGKTQFELFTAKRAPIRLMQRVVFEGYQERIRNDESENSSNRDLV